MNEPRFTYPVRIYYEDTDAGGVVYHANYLRLMERARTEWLRNHGYELDDLAQNDKLLFVVGSIHIDYKKPARLNDLLDVSAELARMGRASMEVSQQVLRDHEPLCAATVRLVTVHADTFKPKPIPTTMKQELASWMPS